MNTDQVDDASDERVGQRRPASSLKRGERIVDQRTALVRIPAKNSTDRARRAPRRQNPTIARYVDRTEPLEQLRTSSSRPAGSRRRRARPRPSRPTLAAALVQLDRARSRPPRAESPLSRKATPGLLEKRRARDHPRRARPLARDNARLGAERQGRRCPPGGPRASRARRRGGRRRPRRRARHGSPPDSARPAPRRCRGPRRARSARDGAQQLHASPCARGARACRRRPCAAAPGGTRTDRARASADRHREPAPAWRRGHRARARRRTRATAERCRGRRGERLAEHRGVLQQRSLHGREAVEPRRDQRLQRLGDLEIGDVAGDDVTGALLHEDAAILEHPDRLDRVERDPLGALNDLRDKLVGEAGSETLEHRLDRV